MQKPSLGWQSWSPASPNLFRLPQWDYNPLLESNAPSLQSSTRKLKPKISLWCTWHANGTNINQDLVIAQANMFLSHPYVPEYILIDDGWCTWGDWTQPSRAKFPRGIHGIKNDLANLKYKTGLWFSPFLIDPSSNLAKNHPTWLIKNADGKPFNGFASYPFIKNLMPKYLLDFTNHHALQYLHNCIDIMIRDWGMSLLKLDHLYAPYFAPVGNKSKLAPQALKNIFMYIQHKYPHVYVIACGCPFEPAQNLVDSIRVSKDINSPSLNHIPFLGYLLYLKRRNLLYQKLQVTKSIQSLPFGIDPDSAINTADAIAYYKLWKSDQVQVFGLGYNL